VAVAPLVLRLVPVASLAAVLVFTGYKLVNVKVISSLRKYGRSEVAIYVATTSAIVITDLLTGVLIGFGLALVKFIVALNTIHLHVHDAGNGEVSLEIEGTVTFLRLPVLVSTLGKIPEGRHVTVEARHLGYIDHACVEALTDWEKQYKARGGQVDIDWDLVESRAKPHPRSVVMSAERARENEAKDTQGREAQRGEAKGEELRETTTALTQRDSSSVVPQAPGS
jgi:MFS superfamily sulfate permease-like transporter